jgi:predicted amidophosphoribosyltransferase
MSLALGINLEEGPDGEPAGHTPLGELEARAKAAPDEEALSQLMAAFLEAIQTVPGYRDAKFVAAVPPRLGKEYDLPSVLAARIAAALSLDDLTPRFQSAAPKGTVKTARLEEKWAAWEQSGLTFEPSLPKRPAVILIDDKYQSGMSIQFVASVLRSAGAGDIYGLCAVKTWRDTDNA